MDRQTFKEAVFDRDDHKCVICHAPAIDAHHIIDRSLWENGGYFTDNGVSLCAEHHLAAERTTLSCDLLRTAAHITNIYLPDHLSPEDSYDHWGNVILPNGMRVRGELFYQPNVQKVLSEGGVLSFFLKYVKFPRTYHCTWSPGAHSDDKMHRDMDFFTGKNVVVTLKMDGENCNMYSDYIHARSILTKHHDSRSWVKALHGRIKHMIPEEWRITGENLYAKHSIHYNNLPDYFLVFGVWDEYNQCLPWDEVVFYAEELGLKTVPELCRFDWASEAEAKRHIMGLYEDYCKTSKDPVEGFVIRIADAIPYRDWKRCTAKWVRTNHVQTDEHWISGEVTPNAVSG